MVFPKVHSIVAGTVAAIVVEVFSSIGFLVLDSKVFFDTSFLILGIGCFAPSTVPSLDINCSSLPKHIVVSFNID